MHQVVSFALAATVLATVACGSSASSTDNGGTPPGVPEPGTDGGSSGSPPLPDASGPAPVVETFTLKEHFLHTLRGGADVFLSLDNEVVRLGPSGSTTPTVTGRLAAVDGSGLLYISKASGSAAKVCRATLPDGKADPAFGTGGCMQLPVDYRSFAVGVRPLPGGGSVAVLNPDCSNGCADGKDSFMLVRLDAKGAVVTTFGTAGVAFPSVGKKADALSFGMQASGALVVSLNGGFALSLVRITSDGTLDTTFGTAGFASSPGAGRKLLVLPNDSVLLGSNYNGILDVERWTKDGAADTSFASAGRFKLSELRHPAAKTHDELADLFVDASGRIYVAGEAFDEKAASSAAWSSPFVARLSKDGAIDTTFGQAGIFTAFGAASADKIATGLGEDATGRILVGLENAQSNNRGDVVVVTP